MKASIRHSLLIAVGLGITTYAALMWARFSHSAYRPPGVQGIIVWLVVCAMFLVAVPFYLLVAKRPSVSPRWPIVELLTVAGAIAAAYMLIPSPYWPEVINQDFELLGILYVTTCVAYLSTMTNLVLALRQGLWPKAVASVLATALLGCCIVVECWAVLFLE